jgi:ADP-ribose pyrophosphatase
MRLGSLDAGKLEGYAVACQDLRMGMKTNKTKPSINQSIRGRSDLTTFFNFQRTDITLNVPFFRADESGGSMPVKINSRTAIHRGKVFDLIKENVTLENGVTTDLEFLKHPGAAAIVPFSSPSRILLLKQYRHAVRDYIWEIPAGTLDPQEDVMSCAKRELIEETGYAADQWQKLGEIIPVPGYSDERIHIFLARGLQPARQNLDQDEIINVHELEFKAAIEMIARSEIQDAKSIAGLLLARNYLDGRQRGWKG